MGRNGKKMEKNRNKLKQAKVCNIIKQKKIELSNAVDLKNYTKALDIISELMELGCREVDVFYQTAYVYYMMKDYNRAIKWVDNTLKYDSNNILARILLGKLCILEERYDDAMSIYEYILQNFCNEIVNIYIVEIRQIIEPIWKDDQEWIMNNYPQISNMMKRDCEDDKNEKLYNEKNKEIKKADIERVLQEVKNKNISLNEKIKILNKFAGGEYINGNIEYSEIFLLEAFKLDAYNDSILRNLAIVYKEKGDKEKAMLYAGKMIYTDFCLLKYLKE